MHTFHIEGGIPLRGEVTPSGNKNAALPLMAACILTDEAVTLHNIPDIGDVRTMRQLLEEIGVAIEVHDEHTWTLQAADLGRIAPDTDLCRRIRASILLAGPGLARGEVVELALSGGDVIGRRRVDSHLLNRSIRYSIERQRKISKLRSLYLMDDLTSLLNRRGFFTLALQQLKMASRMRGDMFLLFVDLDNLKGINDTHGHKEGDLALVDVAKILKKTFRESDIIARIGGDEFAVLGVETSRTSVDAFISRLEKNVESRNSKSKQPYKLSLSIGLALHDRNSPSSIDELLSQADKQMYAQKRKKQKT